MTENLCRARVSLVRASKACRARIALSQPSVVVHCRDRAPLSRAPSFVAIGKLSAVTLSRPDPLAVAELCHDIEIFDRDQPLSRQKDLMS